MEETENVKWCVFKVPQYSLPFCGYKNLSWVWGRNRKIHPEDHPFCITRLAEWWQTVIARDRFFLSHPHANHGIFFLLITKYLILYRKKNMKKTSIKWRHGSNYSQCATHRGLFIFYFYHGLVPVSEIEGKNKGNHYLVFEKMVYSPVNITCYCLCL